MQNIALLADHVLSRSREICHRLTMRSAPASVAGSAMATAAINTKPRLNNKSRILNWEKKKQSEFTGLQNALFRPLGLWLLLFVSLLRRSFVYVFVFVQLSYS